MAYDTTQDQINNPNTKFVQPGADSATTAALDTDEAHRNAVLAREDAANAAARQAQGLPMQEQVQQAKAQQGAPQQQTPQEPPPPSGAAGPPRQGLETVQSEPTPHLVKPPIDSRPYALAAAKAPQIKGWIDDAAQVTGVSPERIAAHAWVEGKLNPNTARGADGEIGMMQILPSTGKNYTMNGQLDPHNPRDNILMSALYMADLDKQYGKDSINSVRHYNGSGPKTWDYAKQIFPTMSADARTVSANEQAARGGSMTPQGLVQAGIKGGPDGFASYMTQNAPAGMGMTDAWRQAEATMVNAFIRKGDMAGAQHARDYVLQMSHAGSNMYLMGADQALSRGDGNTAAQLLAKSHAFFPDDTIGRFRTDGQNVWADRIDEGTGQRLGPSIHITPDAIRGMLNQTTDPQQYLKTLRSEQESAAKAKLYEQHGQYYSGLNDARTQSANTRAGATIASAQIHADATKYAADTRAATAANKPAAGTHAIDKELDAKYGEVGSYGHLPLEARAALSEIDKGARLEGATPTSAEAIAKGLSEKTLHLLQLPSGKYGAVAANDPNQRVVGYLPKEVGDKLAPPQPAQRPTSAIGAGASSPGAAASGVSNNLSGTVMPQQTPVSQSSALPVR